MRSFKRAYIASAIILSVLIVLSVIGGVGAGSFTTSHAAIALLIVTFALFPIFWRGGIVANPRLSIGVAAIFAITIGTMVVQNFLYVMRTGGGEGPNGEGSPLANMIAIAFAAAVGFCPWFLTTLRGLSHWKKPKLG